MIRLAVSGAGGRMGRRIVALAQESGDFELVAALEDAGSEFIGQDAGVLAGLGELKVPVSDSIGANANADVLIDFSLPAGTQRWGQYCGEHKLAMVVGTTGLSDSQKNVLEKAAHHTAMLIGANMSLGVNLLFKLVGQVAQKLGDDYDIEITETHHRFKRDAPSGTALELARQIAQVKEWPWPGCLVHGREGKDAPRNTKTIGMHALRAGDIVGEHQVRFSALGETVELSHRAHSRDTFVRGALQGARWIRGQKPGLYNMFDVLGL
jgi:4-hydroxy-tetrahydrodipicolinate reductase